MAEMLRGRERDASQEATRDDAEYPRSHEPKLSDKLRQIRERTVVGPQSPILTTPPGRMVQTSGKYDQQYQAYQREVQSYLQKVKDGRRVPAADPQAPQFSQRADDERQAKRAGLGAYIQHGPPTPVMQPPLLSQQQMPQQQPAAPLPGGQGIMDWLDQRRGELSKLFSGRAAAPSPVWGFSNAPGR